VNALMNASGFFEVITMSFVSSDAAREFSTQPDGVIGSDQSADRGLLCHADFTYRRYLGRGEA
jgi:phenylalanyl-tRNA synthetase beta subunit